jgi:hypothetical protein
MFSSTHTFTKPLQRSHHHLYLWNRNPYCGSNCRGRLGGCHGVTGLKEFPAFLPASNTSACDPSFFYETGDTGQPPQLSAQTVVPALSTVDQIVRDRDRDRKMRHKQLGDNPRTAFVIR